MKHQRSRVVLLLTYSLGAVIAYGQGPLGPAPKKARTPDDYKPRSMKEVSANDLEDEVRRNANEKMIVRGDILPSRVRLAYVGRARLLPQAKKDVLYRWAQLYAGAPEHYTQPYETELLFREGKTDYWVAVRKREMAQFRQKVKKGKAVDLFLIRLGWARSRTEWEPLLMMESPQGLK